VAKGLLDDIATGAGQTLFPKGKETSNRSTMTGW